MQNITGEIKHARNGKLVAQVKTDNLQWHHKAYEGETICVDGQAYIVNGVGNMFGGHGDLSVYLYITKVSTIQIQKIEKPKPSDPTEMDKLIEQRSKLGAALQGCEYNPFPGSREWREQLAAENDLRDFDESHPEVLPEIRSRRSERINSNPWT